MYLFLYPLYLCSDLYYQIAQAVTGDTLLNCLDLGLGPLYYSAALEGYSTQLLAELDKGIIQTSNIEIWFKFGCNSNILFSENQWNKGSDDVFFFFFSFAFLPYNIFIEEWNSSFLQWKWGKWAFDISHQLFFRNLIFHVPMGLWLSGVSPVSLYNSWL